MDNGGKNEAFFTGLLNKTRKDKIFIVILAGILMMVIAMPTKSSSAKKLYNRSGYIHRVRRL